MVVQRVTVAVLRAGQPERIIPLTTPELRIGRAEDADLCLADSSVSRKHARVLVGPDRVVFEDLDSGNGSFFKGQQIRSQSLQDGDEIWIEPFTLRFAIRSEATVPVISEATRRLPEEPLVKRQSGPLGRLEWVRGERTNRPVFDVTEAGITIGRSEQRDVILADGAASRLHGEIVCVHGVFRVRDPGSANGLYINGRRVKEHTLHDGDIIKIGVTELRFTLLEGAGPGTDRIEEAQVERTENFEQVYNRQAAEPAASPFSAAPFGAPPASFGSQPVVAAPPATFGAQPAVAAPPASFGAQPVVAAPPVAFVAPVAPPVAPVAAPPPNLGAPVAGGFGGVELSVDPDKAAPGRKLRRGSPKKSGGGGFFSRPINQATLGILALVGLMIGFKAYRDSAALPKPKPVAASNVDAADAAEIETQMAEGMELFQEGRYYEATSRFLKVLKLDPGHEGAERMGYVACELIAVRELQAAVESRSASETDRLAAKNNALKMVEDLQAGRASLADATEAMRAAQNLNPGDPALEEASTKLKRRQANAVRKAEEVKTTEKNNNVAELYDTARIELERGNFAQAVRGFEAVLAADPGGETPYYKQAQDSLTRARTNMRRAAEEPYQAGLAALGKNDLVTARNRFNEAVRIDPSHSNARAKQDEVQRKLLSMANEKFTEAKIYESANQVEKALSSYQQVLTLVGDRNNDLYQKAQARIDALLQ